ncbi:nucleotidyl transferase AbiEii/AbiGii toxin family protein [Isoptericola sp. NPDC019482]|uniref:nucleotidyl transferase AbiEii/AbiGii toxin family protein n=1 Tax=Isoptericola sp. NPDC019482 TaxID=3154688 RepID=UPI0034983189
MLRRLDDRWVLKGGYLLEARLGTRARATRDLDLALTEPVTELANLLTDALADDVDGDGFVFLVSAVRSHLADSDELGGPGARLGVTARLGGKDFARVRVDVVARPDEVTGGIEKVVLPVVVAEPGWAPVAVRAVDLAQHVAEKLHALSAVDAHPRPSTRVKDLLDVVLVLDTGALDEVRLADRLHAVFRARNGAAPPETLPDPPASWVADYAAMAELHEVAARTLADAVAAARDLYRRSLDLDVRPEKEQQ